MAKLDLSEFSVPELRKLSKDIEKEVSKRQTEDKKKILAQMKELAADIGMTLEEVVGIDKEKKAKTRGQPKFQNPDNPDQTWTGRGKRPGWINEALQQGKELEDLKID